MVEHDVTITVSVSLWPFVLLLVHAWMYLSCLMRVSVGFFRGEYQSIERIL